MKILILGDVMGLPGRKALKKSNKYHKRVSN